MTGISDVFELAGNDPAVAGLVGMLFLLLIVGAVRLGIWLANRYSDWRNRRPKWRAQMDSRPRQHKEAWFDWRY